MNSFQQDIHRVSLAISKLNFLKMNKKKVSEEALNNVDTKQKEFQKLFRETKKSITEKNIEPKYLELDDVNMFLKHKCGFMLESSGTFVSLDDRISERWSKA